ncbi:MAG: hypothetical protein AAF790_07450 [Planctomycetota bacterium]
MGFLLGPLLLMLTHSAFDKVLAIGVLAICLLLVLPYFFKPNSLTLAVAFLSPMLWIGTGIFTCVTIAA